MPSKLKMDEAGNVATRDGLPLWILEDGSEQTYDGPKLHETLGKVRKERDKQEERANEAATLLKKFGASPDELDAAVDKLRLAKALDEKKLVEAGKIDEVVNERLRASAAAWEQEKSGYAEKLSEAEGKVRKVLISNRFAGSKATKDYILTPDLLEALFGSHFDVDGEAVVAFRDPSKKERIYSAADPSRLADVDEALEALLKAHPNHDNWKKSSGATGSGAAAANAGARAGDTSTLSPAEKVNRAFGASTGAN